jgi:aryl-alcohol dehydrogenase-like predicted oxidoreductase
LGKVLKGRRKEIVLATKFGFVGHETGELGVCGRPDYVKAACAASLNDWPRIISICIICIGSIRRRL